MPDGVVRGNEPLDALPIPLNIAPIPLNNPPRFPACTQSPYKIIKINIKNKFVFII